MRQSFQFRLASVCAAGHETELFSVRIDPADLSTLAAAETAIDRQGATVAKCSECELPGVRVRTYQDQALVEESEIGEFNRRAEGKAPPQNYG